MDATRPAALALAAALLIGCDTGQPTPPNPRELAADYVYQRALILVCTQDGRPADAAAARRLMSAFWIDLENAVGADRAAGYINAAAEKLRRPNC